MGLGCEVDDNVLLGERGVEVRTGTDVTLNEAIPDVLCNGRQVVEIAGVGQFVEYGDVSVSEKRVLIREQGAHKVRADEAGATCHEHPHTSSPPSRAVEISMARSVLDWADFCILVQIRIGHSTQYGRFLPGLSGSSRKLRVQPIFGPPRWAGLGPCPDASARDPNLPKHCPRLVTYQRGRPR